VKGERVLYNNGSEGSDAGAGGSASVVIVAVVAAVVVNRGVGERGNGCFTTTEAKEATLEQEGQPLS